MGTVTAAKSIRGVEYRDDISMFCGFPNGRIMLPVLAPRVWRTATGAARSVLPAEDSTEIANGTNSIKETSLVMNAEKTVGRATSTAQAARIPPQEPRMHLAAPANAPDSPIPATAAIMQNRRHIVRRSTLSATDVPGGATRNEDAARTAETIKTACPDSLLRCIGTLDVHSLFTRDGPERYRRLIVPDSVIHMVTLGRHVNGETVTENSSKRLDAPDVLKGFIITVIVVAHVIFMSGESSDRGELGIPIQVFYLGLMVFFIISGYFFRPNRGFVKNLDKRLKQVATVTFAGLLFLPLIMFCYLAVLGQSPDFSQYTEYSLLRVFGSSSLFGPYTTYDPTVHPAFDTSTGYYYLQVMMVAFVIFYAIADKVVGNFGKTAVTIFLLVAATCVLREFVPFQLPFFAQLAPIAAAFMLLGASFGKFRVLEAMELGEWDRKVYIGVFVGSAIIAVALVYVFPPGILFDETYFGEYGGYSAFPYFVEASLACITFMGLAAAVSKIPVISKILEIIGRHTLALLTLHVFIIKLVIAPFYPLVTGPTFPDMPIEVQISVAVATIVIVVAVGEIAPRIAPRLMSRIGGI